MDIKKTAHRYRKLIILLLVLLVLYSLYSIYKIEVYLWSCENEKIASSCTIVGMILEEKEDFDASIFYYKQACDMSYGLACYKAHQQFLNEGEREMAQKYKEQACLKKYELACE